MDEWKEYKLGEIMDIIGGGTPKTSNPEYWNGNIPWLSVVDFNNGMKYCFTAEKKITNKGCRPPSRLRAPVSLCDSALSRRTVMNNAG